MEGHEGNELPQQAQLAAAPHEGGRTSHDARLPVPRQSGHLHWPCMWRGGEEEGQH